MFNEKNFSKRVLMASKIQEKYFQNLKSFAQLIR